MFTILVLEDDQNDVLLLKRALNKNGITNPVQVLADGDEAIAYLTGYGHFSNRDTFPLPKFIILDLKMPRRSGLEVLKWLKKCPDFREIPKIVLTASADSGDIAAAYALGANSYMVKPAEFEEFQRLIKTIIDYWTVCATVDDAQRTLQFRSN